jgi:hypothetical protein
MLWLFAALAAAAPEASRGASLPFTEYEAEDAAGEFTLTGPDRRLGTLASEASGRRAAMLAGPDAYVEFTLARSANALTVRYAIPDAAGGGGIDSRLAVFAGSDRIGSIGLTSRYGWLYGAYPFSNNPAHGGARHFYDEARLLLGRTLPAGSKVRLQVERGAPIAWCAIDLADFETVPPPAEPAPGALPITAFGADPTGRRESAGALRRAIAAARRRGVPVWIPPGSFRLDKHVTVDRVTILGAGPWHSVLRGNGAGLYGRKSTAVVLRDFAILGEVKERVDKAQLAGIGGAMGGGSLIENLWIQHHKVGLWFDGPMDGIVIRGLRIIDNIADGLNFRGGVTNALVENSFVRNSGDDGLASWSHRIANANIDFRNNTIVAPTLANGVAIYGGRDITIEGNVIADTVTQGGGIHVGNRFGSVPLSGRIRIADNLVLRGGGFDPNWRFGVGALWFYALDAPIDADIAVERVDLVDSTLAAIQFVGQPIRDVSFDQVRIDGAGSAALQIRSGGSASFAGVEATGTSGGTQLCSPDFTIRATGADSGWQKPSAEPCQR